MKGILCRYVFMPKYISSVMINQQYIYGLIFSCRLSSIKFQSRSYGVKLYEYPYQEKTTFTFRAFEYIKSFPEYKCEPEPTITNVFDEKHAIQQLQSIIKHSQTALPGDILRLFSLYATSSRSQMHMLMPSGKDMKNFQCRVEKSLSEMSTEQLFKLASYINKLNYLRWNLILQLRTDIFDECLLRAMETESLEEVLRYFIIGVELYGFSIYKKKGYNDFLTMFENFIHEATTPQQLVQILHFVGLAKNQQEVSNLVMLLVNRLCPHFKDMPFIEAGIAVSSVFKMKLTFPNTSYFVAAVSKKLNSRLTEALNLTDVTLSNLEMFSVVSLMKFLRSCSYHDMILLENLKLFMKKLKLDTCDGQFICHTLAMFASSNFYDKELFTQLESSLLFNLKLSEPNIRIKDISRAMWAFSHVYHPCQNELLMLVKEALKYLSNTGELLLHANHFVDILLALALYEVYDESLYKRTLSKDFITTMKVEEKSRQLSRLLLLHSLHSITFSNDTTFLPQINLQELPHRTISDECFHRPALRQLQNAASWLQSGCGIKIFELKFLIPHINYASLVVVNEKLQEVKQPNETCLKVLEKMNSLTNHQIVIEVNDFHNTVLGEDRVIGLEVLKRRLLQKQGWSVRVISEEQVSHRGDDVVSVAAFLIETLAENSESDCL